MPKKEIKPTSASDWRKMSTLGMVIELPSGKFARIRKPDLLVLVKAGKIPNALAGKVTEMIKTQKVDLSKFELDDVTDILNATAKAAFVEPQVTEKPNKDQIAPEDIDFDDRLFVFQYAQGGTKDLDFFRNQQARNVSSVQTSQDVQPETKQDSGDSPSV